MGGVNLSDFYTTQRVLLVDKLPDSFVAIAAILDSAPNADSSEYRAIQRYYKKKGISIKEIRSRAEAEKSRVEESLLDAFAPEVLPLNDYFGEGKPMLSRDSVADLGVNELIDLFDQTEGLGRGRNWSSERTTIATILRERRVPESDWLPSEKEDIGDYTSEARDSEAARREADREGYED